MAEASVKIRLATPADASCLNELHVASVRALCSGHYAAQVIDGWLLDRTPQGYLEPISRRAIFVAERDHKIVGFGEAAPGAVIAVYVDPEATGRGIGRQILQHALGLARGTEGGPIMVESTLNASAFYERHGFREVKRTTVKRNHVEVPIVVLQHNAA
jgi:putative acetyltransferase